MTEWVKDSFMSDSLTPPTFVRLNPTTYQQRKNLKIVGFETETEMYTYECLSRTIDMATYNMIVNQDLTEVLPMQERIMEGINVIMEAIADLYERIDQ